MEEGNAHFSRRKSYLRTDAFCQLRLYGLQKYRANFGSTYEAEVGRTDAEWAARIQSGHIVGAFHGENLLGGLGYYKKDITDDAGSTTVAAVIIAVIVDDRYRGDYGKANDGKRVIDKLFSFVLRHLREQERDVKKVLISHITNNVASSKVYPRQGFKKTHTSMEKHLDGQTYEEINYEIVIDRS